MSNASLLWCHSGVVDVYVDERTFTLVGGDLLFAPDGAIWNDTSEGLVLDIRFRNIAIEGPARHIHVGLAWAERMVFEYSRSLLGEVAASGDVERLFTDRLPTPALPLPRHARAVAQALVENPADQTSLEEFADQRGVVARTLQRQFLSSTGYSFSEWRAAHRVCVAASLLAHDFSISVAANLVGFAATSSLTRAFRRHTGATPSTFTASSVGMGSAGLPSVIPAQTSFAEATRDQQLWIYSGTATVTTPGYCRFLTQGDMATIPAGTQTRIDVAAGSIVLPVPIGAGERGMSLREAVVLRHQEPGAALNILEQAHLSEELLNTPIPALV
ncbi:helix-turn-helix transcriptional regulator [uncultured Corynebacterium sp.]|uniref:AraC family transcriptional regulator n=1 Tax=uncultured Corynebacterium sp. TaxID=159447 RepID=UPI0025FE3471|nr:helix-turn-helix transcriptional regulator [uncultured Corynebacterium sp.]